METEDKKDELAIGDFPNVPDIEPVAEIVFPEVPSGPLLGIDEEKEESEELEAVAA